MIAIKYEHGVIVAKESSKDKTMDAVNKCLVDKITVVSPYVIGGAKVPEKGQEVIVLMPNKEVYSCVMESQWTKNKIRFVIKSQHQYNKQEWQLS